MKRYSSQPHYNGRVSLSFCSGTAGGGGGGANEMTWNYVYTFAYEVCSKLGGCGGGHVLLGNFDFDLMKYLGLWLSKSGGGVRQGKNALST